MATRSRTPVLVVVSLLAACYVHTKATLIEPVVRRPATCVAAVTVFEQPGDVGRPYVGVARISAWAPADARVDPEDEQLAERKKAAELGANGLILGHRRDVMEGRGSSVTAIFIPADSAAAANACVAAANSQ